MHISEDHLLNKNFILQRNHIRDATLLGMPICVLITMSVTNIVVKILLFNPQVKNLPSRL